MEAWTVIFESGDIVVKKEPESDDDLLLKPEHQNGEDSIRRGETGCQSFDAPPCSAPGPESAGGGPGSSEGLENGLDEEMCTADGERFNVVEAPDGSGDEENENEDGNLNEDDDEERNQPFTHMDHVQGEPRVRDNLTWGHSAKDAAQDLFRNTSSPSAAEVAEFEMDFQIKEEKLDSGYGEYQIKEEPSLSGETEKAQESYRSSGRMTNKRRRQYHDDNIPGEQVRRKGFSVRKEKDQAKKDGSRKISKDSSEKKKGSREELLSDIHVYIDNAWEEMKKENPDISNIKGIIEKKDGQDDSTIAQYAIIDPEKREMEGIKSVNPKQCHICGKLFEYAFHKRFHVQQVHPDTLKRDKRTVADKSSFNARYNKKCFICKSMEFSHPYYLRLHMREDHPEALIDNTMIQKLIRDESGNVTTSKKKCPVCAVVFPFAYQLKYHIQKAHAEVLAEDMRVSMNSRPTNQPESLQDDDAEDEEVKPESEIKIKYTVKDIKSIKNNLQKWNSKKARKRVEGTGLTVERPAKVLKGEKRNETIISQGPNIKRGRGRPRKNRCIVTATSRGRRGIIEKKKKQDDNMIAQFAPGVILMSETASGVKNIKESIFKPDHDPGTKASNVALQPLPLTKPKGRGRPKKVPHPVKEITTGDANLMTETASGVKSFKESIFKPDPDQGTKASNVALQGTLTKPKGRGRPRLKPCVGNENTVFNTGNTKLQYLLRLTATNTSGAGHSLDPIVNEGDSESQRDRATNISGAGHSLDPIVDEGDSESEPERATTTSEAGHSPDPVVNEGDSESQREQATNISEAGHSLDPAVIEEDCESQRERATNISGAGHSLDPIVNEGDSESEREQATNISEAGHSLDPAVIEEDSESQRERATNISGAGHCLDPIVNEGDSESEREQATNISEAGHSLDPVVNEEDSESQREQATTKSEAGHSLNPVVNEGDSESQRERVNGQDKYGCKARFLQSFRMSSLRRSFTMAQKVEVVDWHQDNGKNFSKTQREWGIARKQVRQWCSEYENLLQMKNLASNMRKIHIGNKPKSEEMEQALYDYFKNLRDSGIRVSNTDLQVKSKELASQMSIGDFRASVGWLARWKKRYYVSMRHGTNDVQKDNIEKLQEFHTTIRRIIQRGNHTLCNIANVDQTMVRLDQPVTSTNLKKGEKTVTGAKKAATDALCAAASETSRTENSEEIIILQNLPENQDSTVSVTHAFDHSCLSCNAKIQRSPNMHDVTSAADPDNSAKIQSTMDNFLRGSSEKAESCTDVILQPEETAVAPERRSGRKRKLKEFTDFVPFD